MSGSISSQKYPRYAADAAVDVVVGEDVIIRGLATANVSRGGLFVVLDNPPPPGSRLQLKVWTDEEPLLAAVRVVHVRDASASDISGIPPGMGLEFEDLAPSARARLDRFVDGLARAAERESASGHALPPAPPVDDTACRRTPRYVAEEDVELAFGSGNTGKGTLADLSLGGAYVRTRDVPLRGSDVAIIVTMDGEPQVLRGIVVHAVVDGARPGFGLRFIGLSERTREVLQRFLDGRVPVIALPDEEGHARAEITDVMRAVRRLFDGIERGNSRAALGLSVNANRLEVDDALTRLALLFGAPPAETSAAQATRIAAACRVVEKMRKRADDLVPLATRNAVEAPKRALGNAEVKLLLEEADRFQAAGRLDDEHRVLKVVLEMAPESLHLERSLRLRIALLESEIVARHARELLENARVYAESGLKATALEFVQDAIRRCQRKSVFTDALEIFVKVGASREAVSLAKDLIEADPDCLPAWQALFVIYRRHGHDSLAKRAGRELLRLKPDDKKLKSLVDALR